MGGVGDEIFLFKKMNRTTTAAASHLRISFLGVEMFLLPSSFVPFEATFWCVLLCEILHFYDYTFFLLYVAT